MKRLLRKLRSRTGASITFALLLFLVCTLIGSVILAAGTAAAGRVSKLNEMDQRYYSVTSAADLLAGMLDGQSVTVIRTRTLETTTVKETRISEVTDPTGGIVPEIVNVAPVSTYKISLSTAIDKTEENAQYTYSATSSTPPAVNKPASTSEANSVGSRLIKEADLDGLGFLAARVVQLQFDWYDQANGYYVCNTDDAMGYRIGQFKVSDSGKFKMTLDPRNEDLAVPDDYKVVSVSYELAKDGKLHFTLSCGPENNEYKLRLTMSPKVEESENRITSKKKNDPESSIDNDGSIPVLTIKETTITTEKETVTSTVTWTVDTVEKIISAPAAAESTSTP